MNKNIKAITQATLFTLLGTAAFAQKKSAGYTINGTVQGLKDGKVYISHSVNNETILDSTEMKDGKFAFTGTVPGPYQHFIRFEKIRGGISLFVENQPMTVQLDTTWQDSKVTGSASQPLYQEFIDIYFYIHKKAGIPNGKFQQASKTKDTALYNEAKKEWDAIGLESDSLMVDFVKRHAGSPVAPYVIIDRFINYTNPAKIEACYALLKPAALNSTYGKEVTKYREIQARTAIGAKPSFVLLDTTGKKVSLKDFKGQYVLVDFWASWCAPCRKENPNIVKAYAKYHEKGFEVVAISLDDKKAPWLKAISTDGLPWKHISDLKGWKSDLAIQYGIRSIPASFLVDKDGKIIAKNLRGKELEAKLEELMP